MILTLTPNPTIDRVYYVPRLLPGLVHRATKEVATPSGKGIDVSIILHLLGEPTVALGLNAGHMGRVLCALLDEWGIQHDLVEALGETRTVPVLVETGSGDEYTITAPTLFAEEQHLPLLMERIKAHAGQAWGLVCAGSLPQGLPTDSYTHILRYVHPLGLTTLLDASGTSLRDGIAGLPHILKVNHGELAAIDNTFQPHADTIDASRGEPSNLSVFAAKLANQLGTLARDAIIISMGKHGALAVTESGSFYAAALDVPVAVTNGAGDAMNAGVMRARKQGADWPDALRLGVAAAGAAVMHAGTAGCDPAQVERLLPQVAISPVK